MNVSDLREILQYVPRFRERIFVIAVDGAVAASENFPNILLDIAVLRSLSVRVVLVHGASQQIEQLAKKRGIAVSNTDGTGITDETTRELAIDAAIRLTNGIMEGLSAVDLRAAYANAIIAHPAGILGGTNSSPVASNALTMTLWNCSSRKESSRSFHLWDLTAKEAPTG